MNSQMLKILIMALILVLSPCAFADRGKDKDYKWRGRDDNKGWKKESRDWKKDSRERKYDSRRWQKTSKPDFRLDKRYDHNRRYPSDGRIIKVLPERRRPIRYREKSYFFFEGVWYLPSGPNYVVVRPPIGIVVPILPPFYTTVWFHGTPYYYANDVYYVWRPDVNGYQVTEIQVDEEDTEPKYLADELYIYPKQGQSEKQKADDRYACHRWGVEQTGYDPTQPPRNVSADLVREQRKEYQRAMKACLEGRGYSVK